MIFDVYISDAETPGTIYDEGNKTFHFNELDRDHFNELDRDHAEDLAAIALREGFLVLLVPVAFED